MNQNPEIWAKVIEDTCLPKNRSVRFTTFHVRFPRCILAEINTHKMLSKNAASSRAIPSEKLIKQIAENPFIPRFAKNQKGMQSAEVLNEDEMMQACIRWNLMVGESITTVECLTKDLNIHKQFANRLLEPFMFCEIIISGTEWANFFHQRCHSAAEPSMQELAIKMKEAYDKSYPRILEICDNEDLNIFKESWHLPFVDNEIELANTRPTYLWMVRYLEEKFSISSSEVLKIYPRNRWQTRWLQDVSVGRVAKISYLNLESGKVDPKNDVRLAVQLSMNDPGHWSPFEHIATQANVEDMVFKISQLTGWAKEGDPFDENDVTILPKPNQLGFCGNLKGFRPYRKEFSNENFTG